MNKNKYRFWCNAAKGFITNYNYNGAVDELFDDSLLVPQQFLGILDKNMKEVYEGDIVKGTYGSEGLEIMGEVRYSYDLCCWVVDWYHKISNIWFDTLEIVGTLGKDYIYNEQGELVKNENE